MTPDNKRERIETLLKEGTSEAATSIVQLERGTDSKEVRKAARRALYLLSTRGIRPALDSVPVTDATTDVPLPETLRAYTTAFDGAGNRILFFEIPEPDGGHPTAVQMMINDLTGVQTCDSVRLNRRDLRNRIQQFERLQGDGLAFVEIAADYGRWLLEEARELLRRQNRTSPSGVLELLPRIGSPRHDYPMSPVYESISVESLLSDGTMDRDPTVLFALPWFENWFFAIEDVWHALADWEGVSGTSDADSSEQLQAQRDTIVREVVTSLLTPGLRSRYVRRLEDSAHVLWGLSHEADAKLAVIHAQELGADVPAADVPFARRLVERTLVVGVATLEQKRAERARQR